MALPDTLSPERGATTMLADQVLDATQSAMFFATAVVLLTAMTDTDGGCGICESCLKHNSVSGVSLKGIAELAKRYIVTAGEAAPYRYWGGERVSGPQEMLEENRHG